MPILKIQVRVFLLVIVLVGCQPQSDVSVVEFKVPVTVAEVDIANVEDVIVTTGTVRAPELIKLTVMTSGLLQIAKREKGKLAEGDRVKSGELLANITGEDVRLASRMKLVKQKYEETKKELKATSKLLETNVISESAYEQSKTAFESAKLEYEASLHSVNRNRIVSPIDGIVLNLARNEGQLMADGQLVEPGQVIAEVAALNSVIADVDLIGKDMTRVYPGLEARTTYFAWQGREFSSKVLRLSPTIDQKTRSLKAEIEIENKDLILKPGMFVEVSLIVERRENVSVIPRRSLTQRGGRRVVFVLKGQRVEQREIELGLGDDVNVEIIKGVNVGEKVVVLGLETLTDNMPVRVTEV